jgi:hypothetical protein
MKCNRCPRENAFCPQRLSYEESTTTTLEQTVALQLLERLSDSWLRKARCVRRPPLKSDGLALLKAQEPAFVSPMSGSGMAPSGWSARVIFGDRCARVCASIVYRPLTYSR